MPDKKRTAALDWEDLRYFVALARYGTLSATARGLRVNHATVARRVTGLETRLGRTLFDRRADGYALTVEGKAVLDEARPMEEAALSVLNRLDAGTDLSGMVRLTVGRVLALSQQPFGIGVDVNHRHRSAELQLCNQLEQECGGWLPFIHLLIAVIWHIEEIMSVRSNTANIEPAFPFVFRECPLE